MKTNDQEITSLVATLAEAERNNDATMLGKLLDDNFLGIGPLGFTLTKQQWVGRHASGELHYESLTIDDVSVRMFEATAIAVSRQNQVATFKDQHVAAELRLAQVFVRQGNQWLLVHAQMSPITNPPQFSKKGE